MPESDRAPALRLVLLPGRYSVSKLEPGSAYAAPALPAGVLHAVIACPDELTIIGPEVAAPPDALTRTGFRLLKIEGPLPFDAVGILASLLGPLALAGISILSVSTYNTDYVLVHETRTDDAVGVLEQAGFELKEK